MTDADIAALLGQTAIEAAGHKWKPNPPLHIGCVSFEYCSRPYLLQVTNGLVSLFVYTLTWNKRCFELADPELLEKLASLFRSDQKDLEDVRRKLRDPDNKRAEA